MYIDIERIDRKFGRTFATNIFVDGRLIKIYSDTIENTAEELVDRVFNTNEYRSRKFYVNRSGIGTALADSLNSLGIVSHPLRVEVIRAF